MGAKSLRHAVTIVVFGCVGLGVACVDLFHSTDFATLCTSSPDDPACAGDASAAPDVHVDSPAVMDAAPPHPDFCAWTSAEARTQAIRACAWLGACERPLGESAFGACVIHAQLAYDCKVNPSLRPRGAVDAFWSCLATVKTCGDVDRCVFPGGVQDCVAVPSGSSSACGTGGNSGVRLECSGPAGRAHGVEPCAMFGKTCTPEDPSTSTCSGVLGFTCTTSGGACSNGSAIDCKAAGIRSLDNGLDCNGYGAGTCTSGEAGPACAPGPTTIACKGNTVPTCELDVIATCVQGRSVRIDCAGLGVRCDPGQTVSPADPSAACVDRGASACSEADTCVTPTKLRSCGRGGSYEVECPSVGLGTCAIDPNGRGACAPP